MTMLKKDLQSNKEARKVGSAEHIRKLANKMEVPSMVMREWLGITDNLIQVSQINYFWEIDDFRSLDVKF